MSKAQVGAIIVKTSDGNFEEFPWATAVRVDRKSTLHVTGRHQQQRVFLAGEWVSYVASAPLHEQEEDDTDA